MPQRYEGKPTSWTAPGGGATAYEWDASGNRTKAGNQTFTYDERNRLTSGAGTDYTYTPRGTLATQTTAGTTTTMTFDAFDRLIADGDSLYSYDALDRLASRTRGTAKQTYAYSGLANDLAAIADAGTGTVQAKYTRDVSGGLLGVKEGAAAAAATLSDLHGDLIATFTATALVTSTTYDPFGKIAAQTGTATTLGYQGEYTDQDTGKVNMHARWYQPGTGNFTSRDTTTLSPNPSVQANRYTYANASPLTGTDPTGHETLNEAGGGSTYTWNINGVASGGDHVCSGSICRETFTQQQWWNGFITSEGYDYLYGPGLSDEEMKRLGGEYMANGREKDQPFFGEVSEDIQNAYLAKWSAAADDRTLMSNWAAVGGLAATQHLYNAGGALPASSKAEWKYYAKYTAIFTYSKSIDKYSKKWNVDRNALTAVLIYEMANWEPQLTAIGAEFSESGTRWVIGKLSKDPDRYTSYGIAQLEPYKVQAVWKAFYNGAHITVDDAIAKLLKPDSSIELAAMYLKFIKNTITLKSTADGGGYYKRAITWQEAVVAYCGCSGVSPNKKTLELKWGKFEEWMLGGTLEVSAENRAEATKRFNAMHGWAWDAADEYWRCVAADCVVAINI